MLEAGLAGGNGVACPWHYVWPHPDDLQKGTVLQLPDPGRVGKRLGVAKRYCRIKVIGNTVLQW